MTLDADVRDIACYRLLVAIESALALCFHVSARRLKKAPDDYAACFAVLADHGLVPRALSTRLQKMARFRNLLVHVYWKLDYNQVYDVIQRNRAGSPEPDPKSRGGQAFGIEQRAVRSGGEARPSDVISTPACARIRGGRPMRP